MSSNLSLSANNLRSENSAMPTESIVSSVDIRIDKEDCVTKTDETTAVTVDNAEVNNASTNASTCDLQVPNVSSSNSDLSAQSYALEKSKSGSKISDRVKQKSWYNVIYPTYKSRSDTFKKLFKEVPDDQRLIVDYSCALQREILVHGRMYVSQHYMCFHANIFGWETYLCVKWKSVTAISKEKTALVIPNAILISTDAEKYFITSFAARDKTYLMLFRIWQNALMNKSMLPQEIWQCVHNMYGEQLGLTSDDEDYIDPADDKSQNELESSGESKFNSKTSETETDQSTEKKIFPKPIVTSSSMACDSSTLRSTQSKMRMRLDLEDNNIPTDVSNTTDSEEENSVPFECTAECTSMHEGRQLVHTILPINIDSLLTMLFSKSKFFVEFHNMRKTTNMVYRDWIDNPDGTKTRTINFTIAVSQAVGPKTSNITEVQVMRHCSVPDQLYSIDTTSTNAGIPYADSFKILTHYCIMRTVDDHTMLSVYSEIKYTKNVWGVVKGFIEKNAWHGMENFFKDLLKALQTEYCIPPAKSKSRRTKRALSQKASIEDVPNKQSSLKSATKAAPVQISQPQSASMAFTRNTMSTQCFDDTVSNPKSSWSFFSFDLFSLLIIILIVLLVLLNLYLLIQLSVLKYKQSNQIQLDRVILDRLMAAGDPVAMKENWLNLLKEQKVIHEAELVKWQSFVKSAVDLLQNIKEIYSKFNLDLNNPDNGIKDEF